MKHNKNKSLYYPVSHRLQFEEVWRKLIMLFQFLRTSSSYKYYRTLTNTKQLTNSWLRS